jgi:hypothetical protein
MNKKVFLIVCISVLAARTIAQPTRKDTVAVSILDHMSAVIGSLGSCAVNVKSNYDIRSREFGLVKHSDEQKLFLHGPDKLLVTSEGDKGNRQFIYNGKTLVYYSEDKNQYGEIEAPPTIMTMIDTVSKGYGIDFPVADFFYPTFVDDILAESKNLAYLGITKVNGKECFHIAGTSKDKTFQFWISNDAFYLPMKMVIVYTGKEMSPQYEMTLDGWQINPSLPDVLFEFIAPPGSTKIRLGSFAVKKGLKK